MNNLKPTNDPPLVAKTLQISLRGIFIATTAVAIVVGLLSPWLRNFSRERSIVFGTYYLVITAVVVVMLGFYVRSRRKGEREAGELRLMFFRRGGKLQTIMFLLSPLSILLLSLGIALEPEYSYQSQFSLSNFYSQVRGDADSVARDQLILSFLFGLITGFFLGTGIVHCFCRTDRVELRENGLLIGNGFIPWIAVKQAGWVGSPNGEPVLHLHLAEAIIVFRNPIVAKGQTEKVAMFLQEKTAHPLPR